MKTKFQWWMSNPIHLATLYLKVCLLLLSIFAFTILTAQENWTALGEGLNGPVYKIIVHDDDIYAAGGFIGFTTRMATKEEFESVERAKAIRDAAIRTLGLEVQENDWIN